MLQGIRKLTQTSPTKEEEGQESCHLEKRLLVRALHKLTRTEGNFTGKRLMNEANISESNVSVRTVARFLNSKGYFYLQAR